MLIHKVGPIGSLLLLLGGAIYYMAGYEVEPAAPIPVEITVGVGANNYPYGYETRDGRPAGFNVDVAVAHLSEDPSEKSVAYSKPYLRSGTMLLTRDSSIHDTDPELFEGRKIAVGKGTHQEVVGETAYLPAGATLIRVDSAHELFTAVEDGTVDAALVDAMNGIEHLKHTDNAEIFPAGIYSPEKERPYELQRMVMRAGDKRLEALDRALTELKLNGKLQAIFIKHFKLVSL
ncbi:substrate-binding periplasmic protein [Sutterella megalosphaeroides]|uniref:substrate-binding periplasmic protein n=1 Tax=Sutterella megalosphaeroides TaxID=2494234 RepID=UPI000F4F8042|nr:transporter substrate-binding domain-containing protein [Sutterella megalosphaeroides]